MAAFLPESPEDNQLSCLFQFLLSVHIPWFTATFLCVQSATLELLFSLSPFLFWCWPFLLLLFSGSVVSDTLQPHGLQHARLPCPPLSPRVCSNSCLLSRWCYLSISSSFAPFLFWPSSLHLIKTLSLPTQKIQDNPPIVKSITETIKSLLLYKIIDLQVFETRMPTFWGGQGQLQDEVKYVEDKVRTLEVEVNSKSYWLGKEERQTLPNSMVKSTWDRSVSLESGDHVMGQLCWGLWVSLKSLVFLSFLLLSSPTSAPSSPPLHPPYTAFPLCRVVSSHPSLVSAWPPHLCFWSHLTLVCCQVLSSLWNHFLNPHMCCDISCL